VHLSLRSGFDDGVFGKEIRQHHIPTNVKHETRKVCQRWARRRGDEARCRGGIGTRQRRWTSASGEHNWVASTRLLYRSGTKDPIQDLTERTLAERIHDLIAASKMIAVDNEIVATLVRSYPKLSAEK